ncbi:MAG: SpoIVB peptidase S55 domain-containing protein, partial [Candidatus Bipolaricaulia bacterium]
MRRITLFALLVILLLPITGEVQPAQDRFMFLNELAPGMEGTGKTVVSGSEIATFNVRIVDIVDNPGELDDHILIRASGDAIERSGGIAAGMSGSPIYV